MYFIFAKWQHCLRKEILNQVVAKITEDNAEQLGTDYFEVTTHIHR